MIVTHYNLTFTLATARSSRVVSSLLEASWSPSAAARHSARYAAVSEDGTEVETGWFQGKNSED